MSRPGFTNHPKYVRLVALVAQALPARRRAAAPTIARGAIELLWDVAYEAGDPVIGHGHTVETIAGWAWSPGSLVKALAGCGRAGQKGLLEEVEPDIFAIHDLYDHAPDYVRKRLKREMERRRQGRLFWEQLTGLREDADQSMTGQRPATTGHSLDADRSMSCTPAPAPAPAPIPEREELGEDTQPAGGPPGPRPLSASAREVRAFEERWAQLAGSDGPQPPPPARIARMRKDAGGAAALMAALDLVGIDGVCRGADYVHQAVRGMAKRPRTNGHDPQRGTTDDAIEERARAAARARREQTPHVAV